MECTNVLNGTRNVELTADSPAKDKLNGVLVPSYRGSLVRLLSRVIVIGLVLSRSMVYWSVRSDAWQRMLLLYRFSTL